MPINSSNRNQILQLNRKIKYARLNNECVEELITERDSFKTPKIHKFKLPKPPKLIKPSKKKLLTQKPS
jgi:hypothetical protein